MKLKQVKPKRLLRALMKMGFAIKRQKGSHVFIERSVAGKTYVTSIALHDVPLPQGTLYGIITQSGVEEEELGNYL